MAITGKMALAIAKKFTEDTAEQFGAVKGANCQILSIVKNGNTNTVTFQWKNDSDVTQTSTMTVVDGEDGTDGTDGQDGVSPTVTITGIEGGHKVTITDADGEHEFNVLDGAKGDKGDKGDTGERGEAGTGATVKSTQAVSGEATVTLENGVFYEFTGTPTTLTVELTEAEQGLLGSYFFQFNILDAETFSLELPEDVVWANIPAFEDNMTYQISVVNGIALYCGV